MSPAPPCLFYAPLKAPDHPVVSGDRAMARAFLRALALAGFEPELGSRLRMFDGAGDPSRQRRLARAGAAEAERLIGACRSRPAQAQPRFWFTYHLHYKAPDVIGPRVADALGIPYVVAEGSRAMKRAHGRFAFGHRQAEAARDRTDLVVAMSGLDRVLLEKHRPAGQRIVPMPPFIDVDARGSGQVRAEVRAGGERPNHLLAVAMMRWGDKLASYKILADGLAELRGRDWRLTVAGDGPARAEVEALFAPLRPRVAFRGEILDPERLGALYREADLYVWPAVNEAYGIAFLEAQARGLPCVAGDFGGVREVVADGTTGLLVRGGDPAGFAAAIAALLDAPGERLRLGEAAARLVRERHSLPAAAAILHEAIAPVLAPSGAGP